MTPITITTDDFRSIENLARHGELVSLKIDWLNTIKHFNFFYTAKFIYRP